MNDSMVFPFAGFFDALSDEIAILDTAGTIVAVNAAWKRFCEANGGDSDTHYVGTVYAAACAVPEGETGVEAAQVPKFLRDLFTSGAEFRVEYPCHSPTQKRWFEMTGSRMRHDARDFAVIVHRNISARKLEIENAEQAYLNSEVLAALVATSNDAILSYDLNGRIATWNRAAEKLYGYTAAEAIGQSLEMLYPPGWPKRISEYRDEILAGRLSSFEAVRVSKSGERRTVWITGAPVRGSDGSFVLVSNIHRDITDARRAEAARDLIAKEVVHRAKNMLTVVSAIHRQTARGSATLEEFNEKFGARVRALATSTDLLVSGNWSPVALADLVQSHVQPFLDDSRATVVTGGPPVLLQPEAVQAIGMALHELATNSAKYGAVRSAKGKVDIRWWLDHAGGGPGLALAWDETGLFQTETPRDRGFGSTVLTALATSMVDAEASYDIQRDRVSLSLKVPASQFEPVAAA